MPSGLWFDRVLSLERRFSPFAINSPSSNARRRGARGLVVPIAYVGAAVAAVAEVATRRPDRDARHRRALASSRVRALLEVEITTARDGPAASCRRHPSADPADARGQPSLGRAAHPRRVGEARPPCLTDDGGEVSRAARPSPSPTWRTFLTHHVSQLASIDFFTVSTATFRVLFVFVVLSHDRRRIIHLNVTAHPTAAWTVQQIREAWPWDTAPRFVIRDRDAVYGSALQQVTQAMGIEDVVTAPRSPWQNPFVERVIGTLRRECLDHVIVWNERALRRHLQQYLAYYHEWRTHLSLEKDAPVPRAEQPPTCGTIVQVPHVGGLHHHYERRAA